MLHNTVFITNSTYNFIRKNRLIIYLFLLIIFLTQQLALGQNQTDDAPAFILAQQANNDVELYRLNSITNTWKAVGSTGQSSIRSLAVDSENEIIYAVAGGKLGALNPNTGTFSSIGEIGTGAGEFGDMKIDNVYGLAYDANRKILYASHRRSDFDVLLQINPKTGKIISGSMINNANKKADYKTVLIETFYFGRVYESKDFVDLAYNNEQKTLYIIHNYFSYLHGINSYLNIDEQKPEETYRVSPVQYLASIAFDKEGFFFASFANNQISTEGRPAVGGGVTLDFGELVSIDPNLDRGARFYGLDFYVPTAECNSRLELSNTPISDKPKKAVNTIVSNALINADVSFVAGESISLNADFEVKKIANFEAIIDKNTCR